MFEKKRKRRTDRSRGATTVEFALMLPLLVSLGLVSVDLGRFAYVQIALNNATRAAADIAATTLRTTDNEQQWRQKVTDAAKGEWTGSTNIDVSQLNLTITSDSEANGLDRHTISATYPFILIVQWPGMPKPLVLRQTIATRRYR